MPRYPRRLRSPKGWIPPRRRRVPAAQPAASNDHSTQGLVEVGVWVDATAASTTKDVSGRVWPGTVPYATKTKDASVVGLLEAAVVPHPAITFPYPKSLDATNRKILDQFGNVFVMRTFSSWGLGNQLSNTDITTWLEGVASRGFNAVTVWMGGAAFNGTGWHQYTNLAGDALWSGTPFQLADTNPSSLGPGWSSFDWIMSEATRLELTVNLSLSYIGVQLTDNHWSNATNTQMNNTAQAIANRYAAYPNIVWHVMFDWPVTPASTPGTRLDNFFAGINTAQTASPQPVRWCEVNQPATTNGDGWFMTGNIDFSVNCFYNNDQTDVNESTEIVEATWAETTTPAAPIGDCEPPYDGNSHYVNHGGNETLGLRYRSYATVIEGGAIAQYGHEDAWPFGAVNGAGSEGLTWDQVIDDVHTVEQSYVWALVDEHMLTTAWQPTSAFVTTGEGTAASKAAVGSSGSVAIAYFPNNRTVQVDTTIMNGSGNVRLRWYDPTDGTYTSIAASEAQQTGRSVTLPAAHADGQRDWALVVDLVGDISTSGRTDQGTVPYATVTSTRDVSGRVFAGPMPLSTSTKDVSLAGPLYAGTVPVSTTSKQLSLTTAVWLGSWQGVGAFQHDSTPGGIVFAGVGAWAPVSGDRSVAGYLAHGTWLMAIISGATDIVTSGVALHGSSVVAAVTRTADETGLLELGVVPQATVSGDRSVTAHAPVGVVALSTVTHQVSLAGALFHGTFLSGAVIPESDISTSGLSVVGSGVAAGAYSKDSTPTGLLSVAGGVGAPIAHQATIACLLGIGEAVSGLVSRTADVGGRVDVGAVVDSINAKAAQVIGALGAGVLLMWTGFIPPVIVAPFTTTRVDPERTTHRLDDERTTSTIGH